MFYATSEINVRFPILLGQSNFIVLQATMSADKFICLFLWFTPCFHQVLQLMLYYHYRASFSFWNSCPCLLNERIFIGHPLPLGKCSMMCGAIMEQPNRAGEFLGRGSYMVKKKLSFNWTFQHLFLKTRSLSMVSRTCIDIGVLPCNGQMALQ